MIKPLGVSMNAIRKFTFLATCAAIGMSYGAPSLSQTKQFDEASYTRILGDMKNAMSTWHSEFSGRITKAPDDVVVEALNFYSFGNPLGRDKNSFRADEMDTSWKNAGNCLYQRVNTSYNGDTPSYSVEGTASLYYLDLSKVDWNSSTIKTEYNSLIRQTVHRITFQSNSEEFYKIITNNIRKGNPQSRALTLEHTQTYSFHSAGNIDAPLERVKKSLSLVQARCSGIKSSF